ncbi:MAG: hypothetical protein COB23_06065 [Methylophaga sp.]|nr:MAG: hypothetical protein COB23_06065 [Methylophaga sp.]
MTQFKPFLMVNRLVITKGNKTAYDEKFGLGVNIIRGSNSSGKSTIADFIFYGLGGDLTKFKEEAKSCDFVFTEVNLSGNIFTLKREIKEGGRKGMDIFSGTFDDAIQAKITDWIRYPYNADTKESFYKVIFRELGIPYSKSEDKNSITMHQLLRMMYVDQMTSPDRLFKFDQFDSPRKRQAIGELLIGLSDFSLYEKRVDLQKLEALLDSRVKEIKTIHSFLGGTIKTVAEIDSEINERQDSVDKLEREIDSSTGKDSSESEQSILQKLTIEVQENRKLQAQVSDQISTTSFEINDSQLFITSLQARIEALKETKQTINALSDIAFNHCPACQKELIKHDLGCSVCGNNETVEDSGFDPTFKVRKEIEFQIAESLKLIEYKQSYLQEYQTALSQVETKLDEKERNFEVLSKPQREITLELRMKLNEIGSLNNQVSALNKSKEEFAKLYGLYEERENLQGRVTSLDADIKRLEARNESAIRQKKYKLSQATLELVHADTGHEEVFNDGRNIEFDFADDRVSIDQRALFSASSMVYLKNSFRLAMLKASCMDSTYLYPRFLLIDNIEDKGMKEERSQLFQREVVKLSDALEIDHQIIFTTSMIDEDLNSGPRCVGDFYNKQNKTLKI